MTCGGPAVKSPAVLLGDGVDADAVGRGEDTATVAEGADAGVVMSAGELDDCCCD